MHYLIVGHGIAGCLLGHFLERAGVQVTYLDAPAQTAATSVAAGIINPITGRRYVKSWRVDDLLPAAQATYQALEADLGISFYHERPLIRTLFNRGEENDWHARQLDEAYQ
ncbi:MAG: FAD-dependent oxidoreductase, partial [Bacteroidota bacterium]